MSTIIDSYSESNYVTAGYGMSPLGYGVGQSFTGDGKTLSSVKFYARKVGSPTGNIYAKIFAHSGTYGTSSVPTGTELAVSGAVDVTTISTSMEDRKSVV